MDDSASFFRVKYDSLKQTFEKRLLSLAGIITTAAGDLANDEVLLQLNASESTRPFASAHAQSLVKHLLDAERVGYFHDIALKFADAEAEASRVTDRNEELTSSVSTLRNAAMKGERAWIEVTNVNAEIRKLRHEYQKVLEVESARCREMAMELVDTHRRSATLLTERQELAVKTRSLQAALADAQARGLKADLIGAGLPRLERELGEERSSNAKLTAHLAHSQERLGELAASHQRLKFEAQALRNDLKERDKRLHLAGAREEKNEAQFREALARMESLLEEEAKDSVVTIKRLRERALLAKNRLLAQIDQLQESNSTLTQSLSAATVKISLLEHQVEAEQTQKVASMSAGVVKEDALRTELDQVRGRLDASSQSLVEAIREQSRIVEEAANAKAAAEITAVSKRSDEAAGCERERAQASTNPCTPPTMPISGWGSKLRGNLNVGMEQLLAGKLEEASTHISELRAMVQVESQRRELAEAEVSEAQLHLSSSNQELIQLKHLTQQLEQMGQNRKSLAIKHLEGQLYGVGSGVAQYANQKLMVDDAIGESCPADVEQFRRRYRRRSRAFIYPTKNNSGRRLSEAFSALRSTVAGLKIELEEGSNEYEGLMRRCAGGVGVQTKRLKRVLQGISSALFDGLGIAIPKSLGNHICTVGKEGKGDFEKGLSDFATALTDAIAKVEKNAERVVLTRLHSQSHPDEALMSHLQVKVSPDALLLGGRSQDDFNMLAQLQKIEVESELQSLRTRLEIMTEKYSRAVATRETADGAPEEEDVEEELARAARTSKAAMASVHASLDTEKSRCQDLRLRLERQAREHHLLLTDANQRFLHSRQELDKVQQALEQAQFTLARETARRARFEKRLEEIGVALSRSVSPRAGRSPRAQDRQTSETQVDQRAQPLLRKVSSARIVLEEARTKLRQGDDTLVRPE